MAGEGGMAHTQLAVLGGVCAHHSTHSNTAGGRRQQQLQQRWRSDSAAAAGVHVLGARCTCTTLQRQIEGAHAGPTGSSSCVGRSSWAPLSEQSCTLVLHQQQLPLMRQQARLCVPLMLQQQFCSWVLDTAHLSLSGARQQHSNGWPLLGGLSRLCKGCKCLSASSGSRGGDHLAAAGQESQAAGSATATATGRSHC